jgi:cysteinyl-tRNA synthetase
MNRKAFGDQIDIHGGGRDLIFPHHENEIAQTEALTGKPFANFWVHNGLIKVNGQKMSKSLGNSLFLKDLLDRYSPETVKFALLSTNYRADINVTDNLFPDAEKHLIEFYNYIISAKQKGIEIAGENAQIDAEFDNAMDNDFNTALALSNLFIYFKKIKAKLNSGDATVGADINQIIKTYSLLGLFATDAEAFVKAYGEEKPEIPAEIVALAEEMQKARAEKNYAVADELRAKITEAGYVIKISKDGYSIENK